MYQLKNLFPEDVDIQVGILNEASNSWIKALSQYLGETPTINPYRYVDSYAKIYMCEFIRYTDKLEELAKTDNKAAKVWSMYHMTIDKFRQTIDDTIPLFDNDYANSDAIDQSVMMQPMVSEILSVAIAQDIAIDASCIIKISRCLTDTIISIMNADDDV